MSIHTAVHYVLIFLAMAGKFRLVLDFTHSYSSHPLLCTLDLNKQLTFKIPQSEEPFLLICLTIVTLLKKIF